MTESVKVWDEIMISQDIELFDDIESDWIDDRSEPEKKFEPEIFARTNSNGSMIYLQIQKKT